MRLKTRQVWMLLVVALMALSISACGTDRQSALVKTDAELLKGQVQGDFEKSLAEAETLWEGRKDRATLEKALAKWEATLKIETPNMDDAARRLAIVGVYSKLTLGYYFLADAHVRFSGGDEEAREDEMKSIFDKGIKAAEIGMGLSSENFAKVTRSKGEWAQAIKGLPDEAIPLLYWYSANMGKWALLEGFTEILSRKDDIKIAMDMVEAKNESYYYGAPLRYFGVFYTKLPFPGGDPPKSKQYFERSIAAAPNYLATRVLFADNYATKVDNKALYKEQLQFVVDFDLSKAPELIPENSFEQKKAKKLLEDINDRF